MQTLEDPYDRYRRQFHHIQRELRVPVYPDDEVIEIDCDDLNRPTVAYQRDHVIAHGPSSADFLETNFAAARVGPARSDTQLMKVTGDAREFVAKARAAAATLAPLGDGGNPKATYSLNHLIAVAVGDVSLCPTDEPMLPPQGAPMFPDPSQADPGAGSGVTVDVIDTGLIRSFEEHEVLQGAEALGFRVPLVGGIVPLDYGHGTFVAGVLRSVAPAIHMRVSRLLRRAGAATELALRDELEDAAARKPDIISLSAGNTSSDSETMLSLKPIIKRLHDDGIVLVAAAGNNGNDTPFFPAAFDGVIGVGAARRGAVGRACFSNFSNPGGWVSVYAPGERLVNTFVTEGRYITVHEGRETCRYRGRRDRGWYANCVCVDTNEQGDSAMFPHKQARWSGTSFATPIVSGLIAARLTQMRVSNPDTKARQAADWLLRHPHQRVEGMGPLVVPGQQLVSRCGTDPDCEGDC